MIRSALALGLTLAALSSVSALAAPAASAYSVQATQTSSKAVGAKQLFTETLRQGGKVVGHDKITCTPKSATSFPCTAVFTLAGGTFTVSGTIHPAAARSVLKVTGGTGDYKGAGGTISVAFTSATRATETFSLTRVG